VLVCVHAGLLSISDPLLFDSAILAKERWLHVRCLTLVVVVALHMSVDILASEKAPLGLHYVQPVAYVVTMNQ
jgi:hypothetical protein